MNLGLCVAFLNHTPVLPMSFPMRFVGIRTLSLSLLAVTLLQPPVCLAQNVVRVSAATNRLQGLVNDLGQQLELSFRGRESQHQQRTEELAAALEAWNRSARTDVDRQVMENWLTQAIRRSFPGTKRSLPTTPLFSVAVRPSRTPLSEQSANRNAAAEQSPSVPSNSTKADDWQRPQFAAGAIESIPLSTTKPLRQRDNESVAAQPTKQPRTFATHPTKAQMQWDNPFKDDPAPVRLAKRESRRPMSTDVSINQGELQARVRGYEEALKAVEGEFVSTENPTAFRLAAWTRKLAELAPQYELLALYSTGDNIAGSELSSADWVLKQLSEEAEKRFEQIAADSSQRADAERAVLTGVQRKLRELKADFASAN